MIGFKQFARLQVHRFLHMKKGAVMRVEKSDGSTVDVDVTELAELDTIVDADGNTGLGQTALDSRTAGSALNNTAIGNAAGTAITTGDDNALFGEDAGAALVTASDCTAIGSGALAASTAEGNTAVGAAALAANITGLRNVAVGLNAGNAQAGATDDDNVWIGDSAGLLANGSASGENTGVGSQAGVALTTGVNNTMIGKSTAGALTTGTGNTCLGADADVSAAGAVDQIVIGRGVTGVADNAITLGDSTRAITCNFDADQTWDAPSDLRMKNVRGVSPLGLSFINRLAPIEFTFKPVSEWPEEWGTPKSDEVTDKVILGLGAQDVKAAMDAQGETVFHGWDQNEKTGQQLVGESAFIYPLINAVNELTVRVAELEAGL